MILGWEVHNQGWIKDFSLRSPLCPFFPTAIHPPIFVRCCNQARDPRTDCPGAALAAQLLSGGSPRPLPRVKPEYDPISCKAGWSDAVSKEKTAGGNEEAWGRKETRRGIRGLRGQRLVRHAPGAAKSRSYRGPGTAWGCDAAAPRAGARDQRSEEAGSQGSGGHSYRGNPARGEPDQKAVGRPTREGQGLDKWGASLRGRGSG